MTLQVNIVVLLLSVASGNASYYCNAPTCKENSIRILITDGTSMQPNIHKGDILYAEKYVEKKPISVGDVVQALNAKEKEVYLHRVVKIEKDYFLMKGDNNWLIDDYKYYYTNIKSVSCT